MRRRKPHNLKPAALIMAAVVSCLPAGAASVIEFAVSETIAPREPDGADVAAPGERTSILGEERNFDEKVVFDKDAFSVDRKGERLTYDFSKKRIRSVDPGKNSYSDSSLYANVAFRINEMRNRKAIRDALKAVQVDEQKLNDMCDMVNLSFLFGFVPPGESSGGEMVESSRDSGLFFSKDGREVAHFVPSSQDIDAAVAATVSRFFMYEVPLHPAVRGRIEASGKYPDELAMNFRNDLGRRRAVVYKLKGVRSESVDLSLAQLRKVPRAGSPLKDVYARLDELGRTPPDAVNETIAFCREAGDRKAYVDVLLAQSEYELQTGTRLRGLLDEFEDDLKRDPDVIKLVTALSPPSSLPMALGFLEGLDTIDRSKLKKGYLIDMFRANLISFIITEKLTKGQTVPRDVSSETPDKLILKVLKVNPYITAAYKDLGRYYYHNYEMVTAWECWDLARQFYPHHPMLRDIDALESSLEEQAPQFFHGDSVTGQGERKQGKG